MSTYEEKKALRLRFMYALYELSDGEEIKYIEGRRLAEAMGMSLPSQSYLETEQACQFEQTVNYLLSETLIDTLGMAFPLEVNVSNIVGLVFLLLRGRLS